MQQQHNDLQKIINTINQQALAINFGIPNFADIDVLKFMTGRITEPELRSIQDKQEYDKDGKNKSYNFYYPNVMLTRDNNFTEDVFNTIKLYHKKYRNQEEDKANYIYWKNQFRFILSNQIDICKQKIITHCRDNNINILQFIFQQNVNLYNCLTCHYNSFIQLFTQQNDELRHYFFEFLEQCKYDNELKTYKPNQTICDYVMFWSFTETYLFTQYLCFQMKLYLQQNCTLILPFIGFQSQDDRMGKQLAGALESDDFNAQPHEQYTLGFINQLGCIQLDKFIKDAICVKLEITEKKIKPSIGYSNIKRILSNIMDPANKTLILHDGTSVKKRHVDELDHGQIILYLMRMLYVTIDSTNKIPRIEAEPKLLMPQTAHMFFTRIGYPRQTLENQFSIPMLIMGQNEVIITIYEYMVNVLNYTWMVDQTDVTIILPQIIFVQRRSITEGGLDDVINITFKQQPGENVKENLLVRETAATNSYKQYQLMGSVLSNGGHTVCYVRSKKGIFDNFLQFDDHDSNHIQYALQLSTTVSFPKIMNGVVTEHNNPAILEMYMMVPEVPLKKRDEE